MITFLIYLFMGFLILACVYMSTKVDEGEVFDCNQCETEECDA